jgi:hypothetical protein
VDAEAEEGLTVALNSLGDGEQPYDDRHTPQPGGPGMWPCGNVGPFDHFTCTRPVGHSGYHEHTTAGIKSVWSDVTEESVATQLAGLQRKVRAQANQINKLEELRRAAIDKQPEYKELADQLKAQASLTMRENALRRQAEAERDSERERRTELIGNLILDIRRALGYTVPDKVAPGSATWSALRKQTGRLINMRASERERGDRFQEELRQALAKSGSMESAERTRRFTARFYRLAGLLGVATAGETWDTLLQRVADLKAELEVERVRANARKAELDKLNARLTDPFDPRMFLGPSAEYGATPLAARVAELAKKLTLLEVDNVRRCSAHHEGVRCVQPALHTGGHHTGPGTERWA